MNEGCLISKASSHTFFSLLQMRLELLEKLPATALMQDLHLPLKQAKCQVFFFSVSYRQDTPYAPLLLNTFSSTGAHTLKRQLGFLNFVVEPLWRHLSVIFPETMRFIFLFFLVVAVLDLLTSLNFLG